mmetsp:Transcript_5585/g.5099  ORF Transcript_5585/g.5099 Transcript_5585/m.5099 type:complete len:95 (+) Transcript_5585:975-1259(+)
MRFETIGWEASFDLVMVFNCKGGCCSNEELSWVDLVLKTKEFWLLCFREEMIFWQACLLVSSRLRSVVNRDLSFLLLLASLSIMVLIGEVDSFR